MILQQAHSRAYGSCICRGHLPAYKRHINAPARGSGQRSAHKARVTGQVCDTASNGNSPDINRRSHEPVAEQHVVETPNKQFDWFKQWYPVAILDDLDTRLPMHAHLLGLDLAIWWDANKNQWRAFQDRCPHRLAPLSEGIIDAKTGELYCSYHGWTFSGEGRCTSVPQLPEGQSLSRTRSCVSSYPTRSAEGLLWVWPDASPTAPIESADENAWPGLAPELDDYGDRAFSKRFGNHKWYARDMPYSWLAAKENAYNDISHDLVLHHGISAFANRTAAKPVPLALKEMTPVGYTVSEASGMFSDITRFPCGARRQQKVNAGVAYVVPTGVGSCRQFQCFLQTGAALAASSSNNSGPKQSPLSALPVWISSLKPTWMHHMFSHMLMDADIAIQSRVDYNRALSDHVYMPAAADAGPASFMRWLKEYGAGGPPVAKLDNPYMTATLPAALPRRQLLDRFTQHTAHCKSCRTAYQQATAAHKVAGVLALLAGSATLVMLTLAAAGAVTVSPGAAAAATAVGGQASGGNIWGLTGVLGLLAGLLGGVYVVLGRLVDKFVFVDYDINHVGKRPAH